MVYFISYINYNRVYFLFRIQVEIDGDERKYLIKMRCNYAIAGLLIFLITAVNATILGYVCANSEKETK